jgi:hypothetical protein
MPNISFKNAFVILLVWAFATTFGWVVSPSNVFPSGLQTYLEVSIRILAYAGCGLLIGTVTGAIQTIILKHKMTRILHWWRQTILGYALTLSGGLLLTILIPTISFNLQHSGFLPLTQPAGITYYSSPFDFYLGGFILGIFQWSCLGRALPVKGGRLALLWILGTGVSIGIGIIIGIIGVNIGIPPLPSNSLGNWISLPFVIQRLKIGLVSGLLQGFILLLVVNRSNHLAAVSSATTAE